MNKLNYSKKIVCSILTFSIIIVFTNCTPPAYSSDLRLGAYNFELDSLSAEEQIDLLYKLDYKSLFFRVKTPKDLSLLKDYQQYLNSVKYNFSITSVYFPYRSTESQTQKSYWQKVIDELEGTNISFSIIIWDLEEEALLSKIKEMTDYANERNVIAVLYPHDNSSMPDAES